MTENKQKELISEKSIDDLWDELDSCFNSVVDMYRATDMNWYHYDEIVEILQRNLLRKTHECIEKERIQRAEAIDYFIDRIMLLMKEAIEQINRDMVIDLSKFLTIIVDNLLES